VERDLNRCADFVAKSFSHCGHVKTISVRQVRSSTSLAESNCVCWTAETTRPGCSGCSASIIICAVPRVGEQLFYAVTDGGGEWLGVLVFCAASRRLRGRDRWIGWSEEQRRRRLPWWSIMPFLLCRQDLSQSGFPLLASGGRPAQRRLATTLRPSGPVMENLCRSGAVLRHRLHRQRLAGTGPTDGFGRQRRDFYVQHNKPKRLFCRELCRNARRSLAADKLKPALALVEAKTCPRTDRSPAQIRSLVERLKTLPDYRRRIGVYPCGVWWRSRSWLICRRTPRPEGVAKFAKGLSQAQRAALGVRKQPDGYPAPSQPTFCRMMQQTQRRRVGKAFSASPGTVLRGPAPVQDLIVLDGKEPRHGGGHSVLTAITVPSQHYLGSAHRGHQDQRNPRRPAVVL